MRIPAKLLRHRFRYAPYLGAGSGGPVHGPARELRAFIDAQRLTSQTQGAAGNKRSADVSVVYVNPSPLLDALDVQARAWLDGRLVEVIRVRRHDSRAGAPDHVEIHVR